METTSETCKNTDLVDELMAIVTYWVYANKDHYDAIKTNFIKILDKHQVI